MVSILISLPVIAVGIACLIWLPRGRRVAAGEPRCAGCGYIVAGLPTPRCPECGLDLTQTRAVVVTSRLPPGRFVRMLAWSIFCLLSVAPATSILWQMVVAPRLPLVHDRSLSCKFYYPASKGYQSIEITSHAHAWVYRNQQDPPLTELNVGLTRNDGSKRSLVVDPKTLRFRDADAPANSAGWTSLDADALVGWLGKSAVQGNPEELRREMATLMIALRQTATGASTPISTSAAFSGVGISGGSGSGEVEWFIWVPRSFVVVVWVVGLIWIARRRVLTGDSHVVS